jgi:hypothetical protein
MNGATGTVEQLIRDAVDTCRHPISKMFKCPIENCIFNSNSRPASIVHLRNDHCRLNGDNNDDEIIFLRDLVGPNENEAESSDDDE